MDQSRTSAAPVADASALPNEAVLEPEALLAAAAKGAGVPGLADSSLREPLTVITQALDKEAELSPAGRAAASGSLVGMITRRMMLDVDAAREPSILEERIIRPLIITGLPRTGTTLLHELLAQDPAARVPLQWEVDMPSPPPELASWTSDPRLARSKAIYAQLNAALPALAAAHPLDADLPAECINIFDLSLRSLSFASIYNVPSYLDWLLNADTAPMYAVHRRMLQQLQWRGPKGRWVLKAPAYMAAARGLWAAYPDACVVHTHRDPAKVIPSLASLLRMFRSFYTDRLDARTFGWKIVEVWGRSLEVFLEVRSARQSTNVLDVQYQDLIRDPLAAVTRIYEHFGFELSPEAKDRMRVWLANNPQNKHGRHQYTAEEFGVSTRELRSHFAGYVARFAIPEEA